MCVVFFFNDTAPPEIYTYIHTLSLHDARPISKMPSEGSAPYALLVLSGLLAWQLFSTSLTGAANSLIGNANRVAKIYFPRLVVPAATVVVAFVDFQIGRAHV